MTHCLLPASALRLPSARCELIRHYVCSYIDRPFPSSPLCACWYGLAGQTGHFRTRYDVAFLAVYLSAFVHSLVGSHCVYRQPTTVIPFRDMASRVNPRNVLVIGRAGVGKSTVVNQIIGEEGFRVARRLEQGTTVISYNEATFTHGGKLYRMKVMDTRGLSNQRLQKEDTIANIKTYLRHISPDAISLVLFVFSKGRFTVEEQACFDLMTYFHQDVSSIAALVVTHCDCISAAKRANYVDELRSNQYTAAFTAFMGKGIFTVGFPDTNELEDDEILFASRRIKADAAKLRDLVCSCGEMRLGKQLFKDEWYEIFGMEQQSKGESKKKCCTMLLLTEYCITLIVWFGISQKLSSIIVVYTVWPEILAGRYFGGLLKI